MAKGTKTLITVEGLASLGAGEWLSDSGNRNEGALRAKGSQNGARFYYRYRNGAGHYDDLPLGSYDARGVRGMTLKDARERVRLLRDRYLSGARDLRAVIDAESREAERERAAAQKAAEDRAARQTATLGALLTAYIDHLKRDKKTSARAVERSITLNVQHAWPVLWRTQADEVTSDDLMDVVARLANAEKRREAGKLQSYIRAAYTAAVRSRTDATALPALRNLRISASPAAALASIKGGSGGARNRALSIGELRAYWKRIAALPDPDGALLRFHLMTGGQRSEQLARMTTADFDADRLTVCLRDIKGRRTDARMHVLPLIPAAADALAVLTKDMAGPYLFTVDRGLTGAAYATVQHRVRAVAETMIDARELDQGMFTPGDLRRTVETRLAAEGVPVDIRAQLQSHGLGGIQAKNYDRHDYMEEKRAALETLHRICTGKAAKVVSIARKPKSASRR